MKVPLEGLPFTRFRCPRYRNKSEWKGTASGVPIELRKLLPSQGDEKSDARFSHPASP
jgi:hypothetical protein